MDGHTPDAATRVQNPTTATGVHPETQREETSSGYPDDARQSHAGIVPTSPGSHRRNACRPKLVWVEEGTRLCRCNGTMRHGAVERYQATMDTGRGHQILLR